MVTAAEFVTAAIAHHAPAIELVSIGMPTDKVESYVKVIRSMGAAVHTAHTASPDAFEAHLEDNDVHVILLNAEQESFDVKTLLNICHAAGLDASIVLVGGNAELLPQSGVRDWLSADSDPRGPWVVAREYGDLMKRRQLREIRHRLHETEHRCDALMESSKEAIAYVHEGMHVRANPVYLALFDIPDTESMEGLPLMDLVAKETRGELKRFLNTKGVGGEGPGYLEATCQSLAGSEFAATLEFTPATIDGELCVQIIVRQDTSAKEMERLKKLADRDPHTGLYHRNYFLAGVEQAIPRLYADDAQQFALMYLAIDQFADIRDTYGLDCAEGILKEVAGVLEDAAPEKALLARFGDYSFSLLLRIDSEAAADELADRLRRKVEEYPFSSTEQLVTPTITVGIARSKQGRIASAQEFINRAYKAFQTASLAGGNRVAAYDSSDDAPQHDADSDTAVLELVEFAASHNRFKLRYQPMLEPQNANHDNYFVDLYLRDADDREHPLRPLLKTAQQAGKLLDIDHWLIEQSLERIREYAQSRILHFHIPFSAAALADEKLPSRLLAELQARGVEPGQLILVLDSNDVRHQLSRIKRILPAFDKLGCRTMIDGFRVSADDYALLKHLPALSGVRFDPSLSRGLEEDVDRITRLREATTKLHQLGLRTVVTEVENAGALAQFWGLGVDFIQGEFLSPPLEKPDFSFAQY